jgi:hypothetical protein
VSFERRKTLYLQDYLKFSFLSDKRKELNQEFSNKFPEIILKLSKIQYIVTTMLECYFENINDIELSTITLALLYFEKLVMDVNTFFNI